MLLVASDNGHTGMAAGWEVLAAGGSALDAVEAATRVVEADPEDHSVGYGGYPNLAGVVELDASIMDGTRRRAGAVAALQGCRHPITVARQVLETLPHVLLAGEGASRFAQEMGLAYENVLTADAEATWRAGLAGDLDPDSIAQMMLSRFAGTALDPDHVTGTVNFLAQDSQGNIASAVSTSGWAWKYPGRVGDSPIIGAGNYADSRYGAAACTGWGELAMLGLPARAVVDSLRRGAPLEEACVSAMHDLVGLGVPAADVSMRLVALDAQGNHCSVGTKDLLTYVYRTDGMTAHEQLPRIKVDLAD